MNVVVNGMNLSSACSNHMNPAMSYIAPSQVGKAVVMAGITPVSQAASIGGTITLDPLAPEFASAEQGTVFKNQVSNFFRSVNDNFGASASGDYATENWRGWTTTVSSGPRPSATCRARIIRGPR